MGRDIVLNQNPYQESPLFGCQHDKLVIQPNLLDAYKMYRACLIGYGYWGSKLARNFQNSEYFNLTTIADIKKTNLLLAKKISIG